MVIKNRKKTLLGGVSGLLSGIAGVTITAACCFTPILVVGMTSVGLVAYIGFLDYVLLPLFVVFLGMIVFSLATWKWKKSALSVILQTTITCLKCEKKAKAEMPQNACQWFYDCSFCGALLSPKKGDCCVFCSYGKHACPPKQQGVSCCG